MDDITIKLNDGVERVLRYSLASCKRLTKKFGQSMMTGAAIASLDENKLGELLYEGLRDPKGKEPADLPTLESLDDLIDMRAIPSLMQSFMKAWAESNAPKNEESAQPIPQPETPATVN